MCYVVTTYSEAETIALGTRLGKLLSGGEVVLLDGDLGAGKTHLSKGIARGLGAQDEVNSPTFNIVLEYSLASGEHVSSTASSAAHSIAPSDASSTASSAAPSVAHSAAPTVLRHFDLYRLEQADDLDDIDYFGLLEDEQAVSVVEWGSKFADALPLDYLHIVLRVDETAVGSEDSFAPAGAAIANDAESEIEAACKAGVDTTSEGTRTLELSAYGSRAKSLLDNFILGESAKDEAAHG